MKEDLLVDIGNFVNAVKAKQGTTTILGRLTIYIHSKTIQRFWKISGAASMQLHHIQNWAFVYLSFLLKYISYVLLVDGDMYYGFT